MQSLTFALIRIFLAAVETSSKPQADISVTNLRIRSVIQLRFATTVITSQLINPTDLSKEITFTAHLPDAAFISNFSMQIGEEIIVGVVKKKDQAERDYKKAMKSGKSAGLVAHSLRETNQFIISAHIAAYNNVTFTLTYHEILKRVHGVYKHVINLQTNYLQESSNVEVSVKIMEQEQIYNVRVPKFGYNISHKINSELLKEEEELNVKIRNERKEAISIFHIDHKPRIDPRNLQDSSLPGQLVVLYDVKRDRSGGEIHVVDGYFLHFFAPSDMDQVPISVVFVLDRSKSMASGDKLDQTKAAMRSVLNKLTPNDSFNIILFNEKQQDWKNSLVPATREHQDEAIKYVEEIEAEGKTNIHTPISDALDMLAEDEPSQISMMIIMTDGHANSGVDDEERLVRSIAQKNKKFRTIIHSIAFGEDANFTFLQQLSSNNFGLAKKIYEGLDAGLQLTGFFAEISSLILSNVTIKYRDQTVDVNSLVQDQPPNYYQGSEIITMGKVKNETKFLKYIPTVIAHGANGEIKLDCHSHVLICHGKSMIIDDQIIQPCWIAHKPPAGVLIKKKVLEPSTLGGFVERMWAYQTIKKLLKEAELDGNVSERKRKRKEALRLSLKYGFVTEVLPWLSLGQTQA